MNKNALVTFGLFISLAAGTNAAGIVPGKDFSNPARTAAAETSGITVEQARRIALQRVAGTIEDEYTLDDENENVTAYVFLIKNNQGNRVEIQIDANNGNVLSLNEQKGGFTPANLQPAEYEAPPAEEMPAVEYETPVVVETYPVENYAPQINPNVRYSGNDSSTGSGEIPPQFTLEQARLVAILELNGEIQSERTVTEDGRLTYAFMIKSRSSRITEVRVDAISGKARKVRRQFGEARVND